MKRPAIITAAVLAATACTPAAAPATDVPEAVPVAGFGGYGNLYKTCDAGRAVYISARSNTAGGIAVVDNAPECAR